MIRKCGRCFTALLGIEEIFCEACKATIQAEAYSRATPYPPKGTILLKCRTCGANFETLPQNGCPECLKYRQTVLDNRERRRAMDEECKNAAPVDPYEEIGQGYIRLGKLQAQLKEMETKRRPVEAEHDQLEAKLERMRRAIDMGRQKPAKKPHMTETAEQIFATKDVS